MNLNEQVNSVRARIAAAARRAGRAPSDVTLVAATKTQTSDTIRAAIAAGVTVCGENRVQEMAAHLDEDAYAGAKLHFIGHLQTNKVRQVVGRVDLIESADSLRLLQAIDRRAEELELVQDVLLEVNIAQEENKGGVSPAQLPDLAERALLLPHIRLRGLMCIPPILGPGESNRKFFEKTFRLFVDIREKMGDNGEDTGMNYLSMGMSGDFEEAVEEGATLVRVGTALFGLRKKPAGTGPETI